MQVTNFTEFAQAVESGQAMLIHDKSFNYEKHTVQDIKWYISQGLIYLNSQ